VHGWSARRVGKLYAGSFPGYPAAYIMTTMDEKAWYIYQMHDFKYRHDLIVCGQPGSNHLSTIQSSLVL